MSVDTQYRNPEQATTLGEEHFSVREFVDTNNLDPTLADFSNNPDKSTQIGRRILDATQNSDPDGRENDHNLGLSAEIGDITRSMAAFREQALLEFFANQN